MFQFKEYMKVFVLSVSVGISSLNAKEPVDWGDQVVLVNIASVAKLSASSEFNTESFGAANAVDGKSSAWVSKGESKPWIKLEWDEPVSIDQVILKDRSNKHDHTIAGTIMFSDADSIPVTDIQNDGTPKVVDFSRRDVKWLKFQVTASKGGNIGLEELEVLTKPGANTTEFTRKAVRMVSEQNQMRSLTELASVNLGKGRPDIVVIMADDLGYSDLGSYGGEIRTPNLDTLAKNGLRFTQFYNGNFCAPSRSMFLTGNFTARHFNVDDNITIPEALSLAGYRNCLVGKWHNYKGDMEPEEPLIRGFHNYYGTIASVGSFFAPKHLYRDGTNIEREWQEKKDFYYTDAISRAAIEYIQGTPAERPLFLYVAYTAPHWPLHALPEDIERYKGRYAKGWDELRKERFARMKDLGVIPGDAELSPRDEKLQAWEGVHNKEWEERRMEVYAAQVDRMDQGIGRIIEALRKAGRYENTLILFMSDNGPEPHPAIEGYHGDWKPKYTRDGRPLRYGPRGEDGKEALIMPGPEDTWQGYGSEWASLSATPFRKGKGTTYEGAVNVPLIAVWPGVLKDAGMTTDQTVHITDILPTLLEAAGVEYPEKYKGRVVRPCNGVSMLPILHGKSRNGQDALYWDFINNFAIRRGDWKLVKHQEHENWELYNFMEDRTEIHDRTSDKPEVATALKQQWENWREEIGKYQKVKR